MPRDHGRILSRIWQDKEFRARSPEAQRLYLLLLSQPNVDNAGVQPLMLGKWAKGCASTTPTDIRAALAELEAHRYTVTDEDTEETLVRSYMRNDGVAKHPNTFKNALRCAEAIESPKLRRVMVAELRRFKRKDADEVADRMAESLPDSDAVAMGSESHPDRFAIPSESHSDGTIPSESHPDAIAILAGQGQGQGERSPSANEEFGGSRAAAHPYAPAREAATPPSPHCPKHPDGTSSPCRACGDARVARDRWEADERRRRSEAQSAEARQRAELRRAAVEACGHCDDDGRRLDAPGLVCDHTEDQADRTRRGIAAARAALNPKGVPSDA